MKKNAKIIKYHYSCILICFCAGTILSIITLIIQNICFNIFLLYLVAFFFTLFNSFVFKRFGRVFFAVFAGIIFGVLRTDKINRDRAEAAEMIGQTYVLELIISNTPRVKNGSWRFESDSLLIGGEKKQISSYISLPTGDFSLESGDKLILRAAPSAGFGKYDLYLSRPELILLSKPDPPSFFLRLRVLFSKKLEQLFGAENQDELALALGYLTGEKSYMSDRLSEELKIAGLSHIVVASGFHLGILVSLAKNSFGKLSRFGAIFASALVIICFVSIAGLSASILRAALISGLSLFAWYFGRKFHPGRLLLLAMVISLIYNPLYVLDVAWQLSFASFAGLLLLVPLFKKFFYDSEKLNFIADSILQSTAAQLCCLPLSIYNFGSFSVLGLVSNLLVSPSIPVVMLLSVLCVIFAPVIGLGDLLIIVTKALLGFHLTVIEKLASLKFGYFSLESGNILTLLLVLIPTLLFLYLKLRTKFDFRPLYVRPPLLEKSRKYGRIYLC
ncbi:ComEC/Rec2 family competence protein [Candidatus Saccharibacteria bacterium]|nr:ComEC/Rec2 family competence protein [Candidatus Saccharibacteria bacterium]